MSSLFKSPERKQAVLTWFETFRSRLKVPTTSREVSTSFGATHVLEGGPVDAPPLVVLHGAMASSAHALVELAPLLEHFHVYAIDVIGQSVKSADVRLSVKNDEYARWLGEVLDGLKLQRALVLGVSWGGFVASRFAAMAPERIERLALLVPAGFINGPMFEGLRRQAWPMLRYVMSPSPERLRAALAPMLTTMDDDWVGYLGDAFRSYDLAKMPVPALARDGDFAKLTAPTLVLAADRDLSFPGERLVARARQVLPSLKDAEVIKDCLHCPPTTDTFRAWLGERVRHFLLQ